MFPASVFHSIIVANPILLFFSLFSKKKKITNPFIFIATIELQIAGASSKLIGHFKNLMQLTAIYNRI